MFWETRVADLMNNSWYKKPEEEKDWERWSIKMERCSKGSLKHEGMEIVFNGIFVSYAHNLAFHER